MLTSQGSFRKPGLFRTVFQAANPQAVQHWTHQIKAVEAARLTTPKVMDIYGAKVRNSATSPEESASVSNRAQSAIEIWLDFALMIEEKQYVPIFAFVQNLVIILFRIDVQQCVRQWGREPRDDDRQKIEHLQKSLAMLIAELNRLQSAAGVFNSAESHHRCGGESLEVWDTVGA